jgi:hypothetical protein
VYTLGLKIVAEGVGQWLCFQGQTVDLILVYASFWALQERGRPWADLACKVEAGNSGSSCAGWYCLDCPSWNEAGMWLLAEGRTLILLCFRDCRGASLQSNFCSRVLPLTVL